MKRHIGKIKNTDHRCIVCYMQIPGRSDHALIVQTENLPPRFEQALMEIVNSKEGQANPVLADVLGQNLMPDYNNKSVFHALHESGLLRAVHIDQIVMLPEPNMPFPLRQILEQMGSAPASPPQMDVEKHNQFNENRAVEGTQQQEAIARNLLVEADLLQADADRKRREAYKLAPTLQPKAEPPKVAKAETTPAPEKKPRGRRTTKKADA